MNRLGDLIGHADILAGTSLGDSAVDGSSTFSRGSIGVEVVNHLSVELLDSLGLSTTSVATTGASRALSAAASLVSSSGLVFLGLGGSGRLGPSLVTVNK